MRDSKPNGSFSLFWCYAYAQLNSRLTYWHPWYMTNEDAVMSFLMSWPFNLWSRYSRRTLITWTKDRIREPKAKEPVWYLVRRRKQKATVSIKHFSPVPDNSPHLLSTTPVSLPHKTDMQIHIQLLTEGPGPRKRRWGWREYLQAFWRPNNMRRRPLPGWPGPGRSQSWHTRRTGKHCRTGRG